MIDFKFSQRSLDKLKGVHPDLVRVVESALLLSTADFSVTCGLRTEAEERRHVADGKSQTMNSRHLTGHAVDLTPWANGKSVDGSDPANWHYFDTVARFMKMASIERKTPITWGGDWKTLKDGYHFELTWTAYPLR
jgi:peptidoglycan L-alanyl-D-glutamate endopeptidase CwlK